LNDQGNRIGGLSGDATGRMWWKRGRTPDSQRVSIGQQLIDLKRARDAGALMAREYEYQRKRLIDSVE